jgi:Flp pilus assembly protein TadB
MPASVLLAMLAATALLALTPALVRRYDPDERMIADRSSSDARVLDREGRRPSRPASHPTVKLDDTDNSLDELMEAQDVPAHGNPRGWERRGGRRGDSVRLETDQSLIGEDPEMHEQARLRQMRAEWWRRRHRRILYVLIALTVLELVGVAVAGPGFWIGAGVAVLALGGYVYFLRERAKRRRRPERRPKAMLTAEPEHEEVGPPTYVPEQPDGDDFDEEEPREPYLFENGAPREEPSSPPRPDPRRPDGPAGVRGRSYEAPAKLER